MKKQLLIVILLSAICLLSKHISHAQTQPMQVAIYREHTMAFYLNCGNDVMINIENYPFLDKIRFEVEGAEVIKGRAVNIFTIVPMQAKVTIRAFEEEKLISESKFPVRLLPKPNIQLLIGNEPLGINSTYKVADLQRIVQVKAMIEQEVAITIPKDCRYRVPNFRMYLMRNGATVQDKVVENEVADLSEFVANAQKGDVLLFEVSQCKRMNFKGEVENVGIGKQIFSVSID